MTSFSIGPLAISLARIFLIAGLVTVFLAARAPAARLGVDLQRPLWLALLAGLAAARLGYVATHLADFSAQPLQILYFWQDGYLPWLGVAAGAAAAWGLARLGRYPAPSLLGPLLAGVLVWGGLTWVVNGLADAMEQPLPDVALESVAGDSVRLKDFSGRPVVVNLWATWCPPCRREMPVLAAAQRSRSAAHFVFINQGEGAKAVQGYLAGEGLELKNVLLDPAGRIAQQFGSRGMPTTLFFDARGQLADYHLGELSAARLSDYLDNLDKQ